MEKAIMKVKAIWIAIAVGAVGVGCASSVPPPQDQWSAAQADVGRATAVATTVPEARLHLQLAQEDLAKSKQMMGDDNKRATNLAVLARVEAQLAFSLAKQATAQDEATKAQAELQKSTAQPGVPPAQFVAPPAQPMTLPVTH
jgi:hypothetical protein